ncbi:MAG: DUF2784 domain-containing protein [candidate division KSB1 bacterium]|nr:DUF2784 domain-containing protein [candidate division KSB1 bacterium]MDZ7272757.1 DUF2784 domain-containing protein [candidate division KSB1 bacterium]MDZ7284219.1 DUF2784 domain-containing protein [candidate division KSB1 bacterium]MDZ7297383.1 DUF2784 domain-containing protein [candidate division KSB1 bacterium]MDZ7308980.1 DUF2784 domain-containing protein [candidate division KSB1 bacterium]
MWYRALADAVVVLHLLFILFVLFGGLLVWRWPRCAQLHLPAMLWGAAIEFTNGTCPLTPLENWLRQRGAATGYHTSFIEHYLIPLIYPATLTPRMQFFGGMLVLLSNAVIYFLLLRRRRRTRI